MKKTLLKVGIATTASISLISAGIATPAHAASLGSCTTNIGALVGNGGVGQSGFVGADNCQKSLASNDSIGDVTSIFGDGWTRAFKTDSPAVNSPGTGGNLNLSYTGGASSQTGTWSLSNLATDVNAFILAVKAGSANKDAAQSLLYYKFDDLSVTSGDWSTFGLRNNGGNQPDLSHITVYTSGDSTAIPTPALLPGLVGMGVAALRKRKETAIAAADGLES